MRTIQVGNTKETVVERGDYPPERIKAILGKETIAGQKTRRQFLILPHPFAPPAQ